MDEFYRAAKLVRLRAEFARTGDPEVARQIADIETPSAPPISTPPSEGEVAQAPRQKRKAH